MRNQFSASLTVIFLGVAACQPVIAIGWREGLVIFILAAIVFGPPVYRFIRWLEDFLRHKDQ